MSTTLGDWRWDNQVARLSIDMSSSTKFESLSGVWGLQEFGVLLNGLSRRQIDRLFKKAEGIVSCAVVLADGTTLHMVGAFDDASSAQGLFLLDAISDDADPEPGPSLVPVFQPILSLKTGRISGFEALARWPSADSNSPHRYRDDALASNMMIHASQALARWREIDGFESAFIQVNLTARDLMDPKLVDLAIVLIDGYSLTGAGLRFELTEQAALRDIDQALSMAQRLKKAGAAFVLDDFGTGHSSFLWLAQLPADSLKVDFDLISKIEDEKVRTILEAITLMAQRLGMTTTAEGVESRDLLPILQDIGFDYAQGFALGRPMSAKRIDALLAATV